MADECIILVSPLNDEVERTSALPGDIERGALLPGDLTRASVLRTTLLLDAALDLECG